MKYGRDHTPRAIDQARILQPLYLSIRFQVYLVKLLVFINIPGFMRFHNQKRLVINNIPGSFGTIILDFSDFLGLQ